MPWASAMEFKLLGPVTVYLTGQERPLGGPRQRAVLAALLLHANEEVRTKQLLELVWSDLPTSAESNLRTYLTRLRRILRVPDEPESRLRTRRGGHLVTVRPGELDVDRFTDLAAQGERATDPAVACDFYERALRVWRGRALENVALEPLLEAESARLEAHRERVHEQYLQTRLTLGHHADVLPELRALLLRNPLWERMAGMLMVALHRSGQRTEALNVFRQTRLRLVEELGVEPGAELRDLHQRLLAGDEPGRPPVAAVVTPGAADSTVDSRRPDARASERLARITGTASLHGFRTRHSTRTVLPVRPDPVAPPGADRPAQLPADLPTFTGRDAELAELITMPATGEGSATAERVIFTIDGMAGTGKTTLAVHAAHRLAARYPDGQLFVDLHGHTDGVDPLEPREALELMLRALGASTSALPDSTEARASMYRSLLAHRRMLVVLDNAHSEAQVSPLLPGAGTSRTLITSRKRLTGLLHHAHSLSVDVLPLADAVTLFTRICTPQRLSDEPSELVEEIVELCGRLPLAIRIAAVRLRDRPFWTLEHVRQRLGDLRQRLTELYAGEHSVAAAFNLSIADLEPDRRRVLTLLGLHPGATIELNAAAALARLTVPAADRMLEEFVDAHLIRQAAPGRYELHDLMRAVVLERAQAEDPQDIRRAMRRLLDFYLHTVDACDQLIHPVRRRAELAPRDPLVVPVAFADVDEALAWCDSVRADIPHLIRAAEHHGLLTHACQIPLRLEGYYDVGRHWSDGTAAYEIALNSARMLSDQQVECELLLGLAFGWAQQRLYERAIAYYEATIKVCRQIDNHYAEGFAAMGLAEVNRRLSRFDVAIRHHEHALALYRRINDIHAVCINLDHLGNTYRDLNMLDEAIECYQQACVHSEEAGDMFVAGRFLINLGQTHLMRDEYEQATETTKRALTVCVEAGDRHGEAYALTALGTMQASAGQYEQAMRFLAEAHRMLTDLNDERAADVRAYLADLRNGHVPSGVDLLGPR
ncbi:BTAD domain-containing putative transcriptional regulator [Kibdelosporangium persicum]|uniref:DNA-binding transcriptional activator of the SARP family n=1 Tax=Kibdelosporangium persicum TaxID=2698649 RepID=A0ABX2F5Y1_9PSEU|nr:BTAD domain-containing putative transcriptional regulator [Kibdelosporangium persicum]NRN66380.1 DNA-binding transcriptional activator of the SARP family [Kibdelosporangium persicum]